MRVMTVGELAADPPNLEEARENARDIVRDGRRAAEVITRVRALVKESRDEEDAARHQPDRLGGRHAHTERGGGARGGAAH
jgi:hypothetical protein